MDAAQNYGYISGVYQEFIWPQIKGMMWMVASSDKGEVLDIVDVVEDWESISDPEPHLTLDQH